MYENHRISSAPITWPIHLDAPALRHLLIDRVHACPIAAHTLDFGSDSAYYSLEDPSLTMPWRKNQQDIWDEQRSDCPQTCGIQENARVVFSSNTRWGD